MIATSSTAALLLLTIAAVTIAQCAVLRKASRQAVPFPALILIVLNFVGVAGWIFYPSISDVAAVSARLPETDSVYSAAAGIFCAASLAVFIGGAFGGLVLRDSQRAPLATREALKQTAGLFDRIQPGPLLLAASAPLLFAAAAYGPGALLQRPHYSAAYGPAVLLRMASMTIPAGIAVAAMLLMRGRTGKERTLPGLLLTTYGIVVFSTGSRQLAMLPIMVLLAWLLHRPVSRRLAVAIAVTVAGAATIMCLQLPLTMRGYSEGAGLFPYLQLLANQPQLLVTVDLPTISGNVLFAVPLAGVGPQVGDLPTTWFATSINPLPSSFTNWTTIRGELRVNGFTPLSGLGELANYGTAYLIAFMFAMGFVLALLQGWNARLLRARAALASVIGFGLTGAPTLCLLQYNLRACTRYLWYFAALSIVLHILPHRASRSKKSQGLPGMNVSGAGTRTNPPAAVMSRTSAWPQDETLR